MDFLSLIKPLSIEEFTAKVLAHETFVMPGDGHRDFADLLSLEEIEVALNNGCNVNVPVEVIGNGVRQALVDQNVAWSRIALRKKEIKALLEAGHSFLMMNMSQINPKVSAVIDAIESRFDGARADLHLYVSPTNDGTGYHAHRDFPQHKIYLQVIGNTSWEIFDHSADLPREAINVAAADEARYLTKIMEFDLRPNDVLYMPPGRFHKVRNRHGPRVSFSIPFVVNMNGKLGRMDRTHIPFRAIFESATMEAAGASPEGRADAVTAVPGRPRR